jgi:hypothetical protein
MLIDLLLLHRMMPSEAVLAGIDVALPGRGLSRFDRHKPTTDRYDALLEGSG